MIILNRQAFNRTIIINLIMLKIDLHNHTVMSGHAWPTPYELIEYAKNNNMLMLGISDHGPNVPGGANELYFYVANRAPKKFDDLIVLFGCEVNIIDENGKIDLPNEALKRLDYVILAYHDLCYTKDFGFEKNTQAMCKAMDNKFIKILAHPNRIHFDYDYKKIIEYAIKKNILVELNLSHMKIMDSYPKNHFIFKKELDLFKILVDLVKKNNSKLIVNSDSHFMHEVGDDSILEKYKDEIGLTDDLIINNYPDELIKFLKIKE
jgi:putative hydrolase